MIDTLMMAYTVETVSVEKVMACIHQYSPGNAEVETPYDTEDAVTTWINKVSEMCADNPTLWWRSCSGGELRAKQYLSMQLDQHHFKSEVFRSVLESPVSIL